MELLRRLRVRIRQAKDPEERRTGWQVPAPPTFQSKRVTVTTGNPALSEMR